jgi:broad specificity phosphatase PhoE
MPSILLIRHAQASFGTEDYDVLSEHGHAQVRALVAGLRARGVSADRVISGGLRRQRDTAGPLAAAMGVEMEIDARWDEYSDRDILGHHARVPAGLEHHAGDASLTSREFQDILDGALRAWIDAGVGGPCAETWPAFRERVAGALREFAGSLGKGQTGLAVSSGGVIAALSAALMGLPSDALTTLNHVSINASITKLAVGRGGVTVVSINEHGHLEREGESLVTYR